MRVISSRIGATRAGLYGIQVHSLVVKNDWVDPVVGDQEAASPPTPWGCPPSAAMAARSVCHDRLAHLTRIGNSDTPENTASLPRVSDSPDGSTPVTKRWNRWNRPSTSAGVFPFTAL